MPEKSTRLAYVMSRLGIRAEEMSKRTGIDKTLISRWKNGQRRLSQTSSYSKRIGAFLLSLDNADAVVGKTLNAYGLDESQGTLLDNFIFWLTEQETPALTLRSATLNPDSREYTASFRVFLGGAGLRSAIITMLDYVMTLPQPQNIVAVALSDYAWVLEEPEFLSLLVERLRVAFERGVTLTLVSRENFNANMAQFSAHWLAAHLQGYIKSYYYREDEAESFEQVLIATKDGVCLRLTHDAAVDDGLYAAMYTDAVTVRQTYNTCMEYFAQAKMQFRYGLFTKPGNFLKNIQSTTMLNSACYVCNHTPSLGAIPIKKAHLYAQGTLRDTKQRTEQLQLLFCTPDQFAAEAKIRHIYCLESVEQMLQPSRTVDYPLSAIYEKRIHHSHRLVLDQLQRIRLWLKTLDNYEAVFLPAQIFERFPLDFLCVQGNFCVAWPADAASSTCVKDHNKVDTLFAFAEQAWAGLPKYCKERSRSLRLINQWLEESE